VSGDGGGGGGSPRCPTKLQSPNPTHNRTHKRPPHPPQLPEVYAKLREEQARVVAEHGPALTRKALDASTYLDCLTKEVQYLHPSASMNFRWALGFACFV